MKKADQPVQAREGGRGRLCMRACNWCSTPFLLVIVSLLLGRDDATAQVNTERLTSEATAPGLSGHLDFDLASQSGNVDLLSVRGGFLLQYATGPRLDPDETELEPADFPIRNVYLFVVSRELARVSGELVSNRGFGFASWTHLFTPTVGVSIVGQVEYDDFTLIDRRVLSGTVVRYRRRPSEFMTLEVGTGYMYEYQDLDVPPTGPDEQETWDHRSISLVLTSFALADDKVSINNSFFIQPRFDEPSDYRILDEAEVMITITDLLSLGTSLSLRYDSRPPTGIERTDVSLASRLRFRF